MAQDGTVPAAPANAAGERSLLIADDDAPLRQRLARALELRGFVVTAVGSVAEAMALASKPPAFAVL
ncbi:MAG: two-component system response regulator, partial [Rhodospirillales bacterium]|nr:two-component system response regulator [Rhodospirillales bacterium]